MLVKKGFNPFKNYLINKRRENEKENWSENRCPSCNALLYKVNKDKFAEGSVQIKCRLCKKIEVQ